MRVEEITRIIQRGTTDEIELEYLFGEDVPVIDFESVPPCTITMDLRKRASVMIEMLENTARGEGSGDWNYQLKMAHRLVEKCHKAGRQDIENHLREGMLWASQIREERLYPMPPQVDISMPDI